MYFRKLIVEIFSRADLKANEEVMHTLIKLLSDEER